MTAPKKKPAKKAPPKKPPPRVPLSRTQPQTGPGRPRKPKRARDMDDDDIAEIAAHEEELIRVEQQQAEAMAAFEAEPTIVNKVQLLAVEMRVAATYASFCRTAGIYTHAIKYTELLTKLAARHTEAVDQRIADDIEELERKLAREIAAARSSA